MNQKKKSCGRRIEAIIPAFQAGDGGSIPLARSREFYILGVVKEGSLMLPKLFVATKAFIQYKDRVLLLRESTQYSDGSNAGKFDVVGGRITPGEHFAESLLREIKEETGLEATITEPFFVSEWRPSVRGEQWQIVGIYFVCTVGSDGIELSNDHDHYEWIDPREYESYNLIDNVNAAFEAYVKRYAT